MAPSSRSFERAYRRGRTPWDTGVTPPEIVEQASAMHPGRALDLGCGTGTTVLWLARRGWTAVGVDRSALAIESARRKADWTSGAVFVEGDVTRLDDLEVDGPFDLLLDVGCFHGLPARRRGAYVRQVTRVAAPGARMMIFAFRPRAHGGRARRGRASRRSGGASERPSSSNAWCPGGTHRAPPGSTSAGVDGIEPAARGRRSRNRPVACPVSHTGGITTTTSRRRSTAPATAFATVVLILVFAAPASAGGRPGDAGAPGTDGATAPLAPTPPAGALPGIDVSNHQGAIDWSLVAASGTRFAFAKATEGRTFADAMYATNRAGAVLSGVEFGAYHFARPDGTANDAIIEADHFVDVAQPRPGDLIPVLDIESTGGLTQAQVTQWILDWLGRVTERVGVRPMVYTSPNGWENRTGDTTAVAAAGYTMLWVAHWGVMSPSVPAGNWGGNGWTFWQYGNCGTIAGIDGCVDVDWYETGSFVPVTIPVPDDVPPTATFGLPATPGEPISITFSEIVHRVTPENVFVWIPGKGARPDVELSCRSGKGRPVDCVAGNVRTARVRPLEPLVLGETYEAVVNPPTAPTLVVDRSANPVPTATQAFTTPTDVEDDSPAISYAWRTASKARAKGGRYAVEHRAGATASFAFEGGTVTWYTAVGPDGGKAAVSIDGVRRGTFDAYAARADFGVARTFDGLGPGAHTITIRVIGRARASATDTQVVVDAFRAGGRLVSNPDLLATWGTVGRGGASGGSLGSSDLGRSSAELMFRGTGIEWFTYRGRDQGRAEVYVDGRRVRTVDNFATGPMFDVSRSITGLPEGVHTLRIVVLATSRPAATGALVSIDRFAVVA